MEVGESLCERLWSSFRFSCHLARSLLPYLLLGIAVAGYVEAYLPPRMVAAYLSGCLGVVLGVVMGAPMHRQWWRLCWLMR